MEETTSPQCDGGRECGGGAGGLDGLPRAAAEVLEGYFSGRGVPPEKCGV